MEEALLIKVPEVDTNKILLELPAPKARDFVDMDELSLPPPAIIAETILKYFFRRKSGYEDIKIILPDGTEKVETRFVNAKLPLLSEVARLFSLTKAELIFLAKKHPDTIGRACDAALDVADENMVHNTLSGEYHPSASALVAPFASRIVSRQQVKIEDTKKVGLILDDIERNKLPYAS